LEEVIEKLTPDLMRQNFSQEKTNKVTVVAEEEDN
jgi:hypothetical protein